MRRSIQDLGFVALRLEGGILPAEFLQKIAALDASQQTAVHYGLPKGLSLKDEIGRAWRIASAEWAEFQDHGQRKDIDPKAVGVDGWLRALLIQVLGYNDLKTSSRVHIDERSFAISHHASRGAVPLVLTTHAYPFDKGDPTFGEEGRRRSPHALVQEYLNAEDTCLWGIASNGIQIRLLRDNPSLTRPTFIEADLKRIFEEQLYADFSVFWLIFHASRVRTTDDKPDTCILENWRKEGHKTGERALASLREGVTTALKELGSGFLQHRNNGGLRAKLRDGDLSAQAYFQQLLRLVYRLLFLATSEERDLLHTPGAGQDAKALYSRGYSLVLLRDRALKRRYYDTHNDLWEGLQITFQALERGAEPLGLPALGGLFASDQCPTLNCASIENGYLLSAIHALCFFRTGNTLTRVNYRDMGTEELGSVYESLLELHPYADVDATPWTFRFQGEKNGDKTRGSERKISGSYYTPKDLVNELIKTTLEPIIERTKSDNPKRPREALLKLNIVDPACGSGHFLLAAARRLAAEIARLDSVTHVPDERSPRHALREVVRHCIYGVDKNPLAVELCRLALWIETVDPGRPLSFLAAHIRCGDSLVGILDPKVMDDGIPDKAYKPLKGDETSAARDLKKNNRQTDRSVQGNIFDRDSFKQVIVGSANLDAMPEDTIEEIENKKKAREEFQHDSERNNQELRANLYVGAFFEQKTFAKFDQVPLTEDLNRIEQNLAPRPGIEVNVKKLAEKYRFFHWHLAFPKVIAEGGFDVTLGNPPWEKIKLQEKEFFEGRSSEISEAPNKAAREKLIKVLFCEKASLLEKGLGQQYIDAKRRADATSFFFRCGGRYPLSAVGDVNTYALFAELIRNLLNKDGHMGCVLPTGISTDDTTKKYFQDIVRSNSIISLYDFENKRKIFPNIDSRLKFCLLTTSRGTKSATTKSKFVFFALEINEIKNLERMITLTSDDITLINPNTYTCPIFRTSKDAVLTKAIYRRVPVLIRESRDGKPEENPWGIKFNRMFDMANDSYLFKNKKEMEDKEFNLRGNTFVQDSSEYLPLYEAKMVHQFDHRFNTYEKISCNSGLAKKDIVISFDKNKNNPCALPMPRYWIQSEEVNKRWASNSDQWTLVFRNITNVTNMRTAIFSILPKVGVGNSAPVMKVSKEVSAISLCLYGSLASFVLDFATRQSVGGTNLNYFTLKQLPVLLPRSFEQICPWSKQDISLCSWLSPRIIELTYTAWDLEPFARDFSIPGPPFRWNDQRRFLLRCELDAAYFHLYLPTEEHGNWRPVEDETSEELELLKDIFSRPRDAVNYILDTFPIVQRQDEEQYSGDFRTKRVILEIYDAMQDANRNGNTYKTLLNPPPADPSCQIIPNLN